MKEKDENEGDIKTNSIENEEKEKEKEDEEKEEEENIQNEEKENQIEPIKYKELEEPNSEFDENIFFNHYYLAQREMEIEPIITGKVFPYIMSREFLYSYFEDKKNYKVGVKETYPQILGRVKQFMNSNDDNFNKIFLDNIKLYTELLGQEKTETIIIPVLSKIVEDKINTKIYFLKFLESFIEYLYNLGEDGIEILKNNILNIFDELYRAKFRPNKDQNMNNKKNIVTEEQQKEYDDLLFERFVQVSKLLIKAGNKEFIYDIILNFKNEKIEENTNGKKILLIKLITNLSVDFGEEFTKEKILPVLDEFMKEDNIEIKEEICLNYITLIKLLNLEFIGNYIYHSLEEISKDKLWILRKKCIEILSKIIYELKNKYKKEDNDYNKVSEHVLKIVSLFESFISDKKKKVRYFLIEKIGEIIKPLDKEELSDKLFAFYTQTIKEYYEKEEHLLDLENKNKISFYFAYNFPAVLLYYSPKSWEQLKNLYTFLCNDENTNVRSSIINSFYEISKILGKEITKNELLPIYNKFLECEENSFTKKLAEKNLPKILSELDKETREKYFNNNNIGYNYIISNETNLINKLNQNKKIEYLKNIVTYYTLYDNDIIYNNILPKCIYFSLDTIYKVRATSCKIIGEIILYLYKKDFKKDKLLKLIEVYAFNKKYKQRINFVKICKTILLVDDILYNEKLKELLFTIANKEKNLNVLIALAKSLKKLILTNNSKCGNESSIHYLCKKIDLGKCLTINNLFKNVNLQKNEKLEIVGNIPEGDVFKLDNDYLKEEFKVETNMKKKIININNDNEDNKFIN
jgi:hypothetical protein